MLVDQKDIYYYINACCLRFIPPSPAKMQNLLLGSALQISRPDFRRQVYLSFS